MTRTKSVTGALVLALLLSGSQATAQAPIAPDARLDTTAVDEALDLYWGQQREIEPLQRRNNSREWRHEFTLFGGVVPNERFYSFYPVGARYDMYFSSDAAIEAWGSYLIDQPSELYTFYVTDPGLHVNLLGELPPQLEFLTGLSLLWSPIHGKFAAFGAKLTHFDFYFVGGLTLFGTTVTDTEVALDGSVSSDGEATFAMAAGGHAGLGLRVQFLDWLAMRIEYRQHFYGPEEGANPAPAEFNFGLSFWTPGGEE